MWDADLAFGKRDVCRDFLDVASKEGRQLLVQHGEEDEGDSLRRERSGLQLLAVAGVKPEDCSPCCCWRC